MATYIRYATRVYKYVIDLSTARNREIIDTDITAVTILDKGTGTFTLSFVFKGQVVLELTQDEVLNGDVLCWDTAELRITNTAQPGKTLKILVDKQVLQS